MAGFALAKYEFRGKTGADAVMLGSMMIRVCSCSAPLYKMVVDLGLVDSAGRADLPSMVTPTAFPYSAQACMSGATK